MSLYTSSAAAAAAAAANLQSEHLLTSTKPAALFKVDPRARNVTLAEFSKTSSEIQRLLETAHTSQDEIAPCLYARDFDTSALDTWRGRIRDAGDSLRSIAELIDTQRSQIPHITQCTDFLPLFKTLQQSAVQHYQLSTKHSMLSACTEGTLFAEVVDFCKSKMDLIVTHTQSSEPVTTRACYLRLIIADITQKNKQQLRQAQKLHPSLQSLIKEMHRETLQFCLETLKKFPDKNSLQSSINSVTDSLADLQLTSHQTHLQLSDDEISRIQSFIDQGRSVQFPPAYQFNRGIMTAGFLATPLFPELSSRIVPSLQLLMRGIIWLRECVTQRITGVCQGDFEPRYATSNAEEIVFFKNVVSYLKAEIKKYKNELYEINISPNIPKGLHYIAQLRFTLSEAVEYIELLNHLIQNNFLSLSRYENKLIQTFGSDLDPLNLNDITHLYQLVDAIHAFSPQKSVNPFVEETSTKNYKIFEQIVATLGEKHLKLTESDTNILDAVLSQNVASYDETTLSCFIHRSLMRYLFFSNYLPDYFEEFTLALHILNTNPQFQSLWNDSKLGIKYNRFRFSTNLELERENLTKMVELFQAVEALRISEKTEMTYWYYYAKAIKMLQMPRDGLSPRIEKLLDSAKARFDRYTISDNQTPLFHTLATAIWPSKGDNQEQAVTESDQAITEIPLDDHRWIQSNLPIITLVREFALMKLLTDRPLSPQDRKSLVTYLGRYLLNSSNEEKALREIHGTVFMERAVYKLKDEVSDIITTNRPRTEWNTVMHMLANFGDVCKEDRQALYEQAKTVVKDARFPSDASYIAIFTALIQHMQSHIES